MTVMPTSPGETFFGHYKGIVSNNIDPEGMGRIKAICPTVYGNSTTETDWAWPSTSPGAPFVVPNPGVGVWLAFEGGDVDYPIWVGVWNTLTPAIEGAQPAKTVVGPDAFGAPAVVGADVTFAREDHDHGLPPIVGAAPWQVRVSQSLNAQGDFANTVVVQFGFDTIEYTSPNAPSFTWGSSTHSGHTYPYTQWTCPVTGEYLVTFNQLMNSASVGAAIEVTPLFDDVTAGVFIEGTVWPLIGSAGNQVVSPMIATQVTLTAGHVYQVAVRQLNSNGATVTTSINSPLSNHMTIRFLGSNVSMFQGVQGNPGVNGAGSFIGEITGAATPVIPPGWYLCDGTTRLRTTFSALFAAICPIIGFPTITIASPGVISLTAHPFVAGDTVYLTTTGALPTGLSPNVLYFVVSPTTNTFDLSLTRGGAAINTTGSQSGTHTVNACPYGLGDGSTTFNLPNFLGSAPLGAGTSGQAGATAHTMGQIGGEETHLLLSTESGLVSHKHQVGMQADSGVVSGNIYYTQPAALTLGFDSSVNGGDFSGDGSSHLVTAANAASAHNNLAPYQGAKWIIYAGV